MTVKELKTKLDEFDDNLEVIQYNTEDGYYSIEVVRKTYLGGNSVLELY